MSCGKYREFERGKMSAEALADHARECPDCRAASARDRRLLEETMSLRTPIPAPGLWDRIESALRAEAAAGVPAGRPAHRESGLTWARFRPFLIPMAASLLLLVAAGIFWPSRPGQDSGLLAGKTLANVEAREADYLASIRDLERLARPKIREMDLTLMSLYRDRLAVIDSQIAKCRAALDSNPTNAHIRQYLLAALQDKKQTLAEVLGS